MQLRLRAARWLTGAAEFQDARAFGYTKPVPGSVANRFDLRQAWLRIGLSEDSGWTLRAGRMPLKLGAGRLVWDPDWGNTGAVFDAQETTGLIEETVTRAGEGQQRLEELSRSLTQLTPAARVTRERLDEVRQASREQTKGLALIGSAMSRLEGLTQQVAAGAEQCAAASQELAGQAASMAPVVDGLRRMAG